MSHVPENGIELKKRGGACVLSKPPSLSHFLFCQVETVLGQLGLIDISSDPKGVEKERVGRRAPIDPQQREVPNLFCLLGVEKIDVD